MVPREYLDWLDVVEPLGPQAFPDSTTNYAVKVAVALRDENRELRDVIDQLLEPEGEF